MAEHYYRDDLCRLHLENGLETLLEDAVRLDGCTDNEIGSLKELLIGSTPAALFIRETGCRLRDGVATEQEIHLLILLSLVILHQEIRHNDITF
ncbi:MAG: hypothetical protein EOM21_21585 [Gammaproteobacteria bacterium]|nr:hypothetical protein [Gammaproteobacteria bacterium]